MVQIIENWRAWLWAAGILTAAYLLGLILHRVIFSVLERLARRTPNDWDQVMVARLGPPARTIIPVLLMLTALPSSPLPGEYEDVIRHGLILVLIGGAAWLAVAIITALEEAVQVQYRLDVADNLNARRIRTQFQVMHRVVVFVIAVIALSAMLMTFPSIRSIGAGLFASAGAAGLVLGIALRPVLENLLAGIQIALTEPIRIDDVVIVEGEWGRIEEISTTYVVVRIWDLRRLVVPLSYFIQKPFQNWTRSSADLLGTVFIYTDYSVPVEEVRAELRRILEASGMWDGKVCGLVVTNATERTLELRALLSAPDSGTQWDLRCLVREKLIEYLKKEYPESLPKVRAEMQGLAPGAGEANPRVPGPGEPMPGRPSPVPDAAVS